MSVNYPPPEKEAVKPGDTAKRIVVFFFGVLLVAVGIAAAIKKEFVFAFVFLGPGFLFLAIAGWGSRRSVGAAKAVTEVTQLIP